LIGFSALASVNGEVVETSQIRLVGDHGAFSRVFAEHTADVVADEGLKWTEGPVYSEKHDMLYFSDVVLNKINAIDVQKDSHSFVALDKSGEVGAIVDESRNLAEAGSNGLSISPANDKLYVCQHSNRRVASVAIGADGQLGEVKPVAEAYEGHRLNSPNDVVAHPSQHGRIFFTDPPYGLMTKDTYFDGHHLNSHPERELSF